MRELQSQQMCLRWMARRRLVKNSCSCAISNMPATLAAYAQGQDGVRWSCRNCNFRQTVRAGSFFEASKLSLVQITLLTYYWSSDVPQTFTMHETNTSKKTVIDWCNFCREECEQYIIRHAGKIGGMDAAGNPIVVEIDETLYF